MMTERKGETGLKRVHGDGRKREGVREGLTIREGGYSGYIEHDIDLLMCCFVVYLSPAWTVGGIERSASVESNVALTIDMMMTDLMTTDFGLRHYRELTVVVDVAAVRLCCPAFVVVVVEQHCVLFQSCLLVSLGAGGLLACFGLRFVRLLRLLLRNNPLCQTADLLTSTAHSTT